MRNVPRQVRQRIHFWRKELERHLDRPIATVSFDGFTTPEHLTQEEAQAHTMTPFPAGTAWGAMWEYGWFRAQITLPAECEGKRVIFRSGLGGEQLVLSNGEAIGSIDREHHDVTLSRCAQAGESFSLLIESYAGHGARLENLGPCPPERKAIPPTPPAQCTVTASTLCIFNEDAYQLCLDVETLCRLLEVLPDKSLRAMRVQKALEQFTNICDFELPEGEARNASFRKAREALREVMNCHNGSTAPLLWLIGQSHIDLAWLWPVEETFHKSARTFSNQLYLMEEYPEFRFLLCEPALLEMLKKQSPALWEKTKAAVARGQMVPEGAFYVECDFNVPGGESLIRQLMWGKRWFREELGIDSKVAWHPDTFGYSACMPQILRGFDVPYFITQKLLRADPECERFPHQHFIWEGMDGSEVLGVSYFNCNSKMEPLSLHHRWEEDRTQQEEIDTLLYPFGFGDGGGGPTRNTLEMARRMQDLEGLPRTRYGGVREYCEHIEKQGVTNRWVGELYLSWHRGTHTSQRKTKALIRRAETAIHAAEGLVAMLESSAQVPYRARLHDLWDALMLCQFHDVAPGTSIKRVHDTAEAALSKVCADADEIAADIRRALAGIREDGAQAVAVNTLPWPRRIRMDGAGMMVEIPANSVVNLSDCPQWPLPDDCCAAQAGEDYVLENRFLSVTVGKDGCITRLYDKAAEAELLAPGQKMNDWRLYQNVESVYDAWEMSRNWQSGLLPDAIEAEVTLSEQTPSRISLCIRRRFGHSTSIQKMTLEGASRLIAFDTTVDWHERHRLLKAHFESNVISDEAIHEIQFGYVKRPTHKSHAFAADRYEVCNQRYSALSEGNRGFAVLNDGIWGLSTDRGELALSLLRAPLVPDEENNIGTHHFTYALMPFAGAFEDSGIVRAGYALNDPPRVLPQSRCAQTLQGPWCESDSVLLETVKPAEDGNGMILRLYESLHRHARAVVHLPFAARWYDCGMDESKSEPLGEGSEMTIALRAFEIKTLRAIKI